MITSIATLVFGLASIGSCPGQTSVDTPSKVLFKVGTEVSLAFAWDLSSETSADGDPALFTLTEDSAVDGFVVAGAGANATAEVTNVRRSE